MNYSFPPGRRKRISRFCKILASASFVPETIVTNDDIISKHGLPFKSRVIVKSIGVEKRHVAIDHLTDSDLLVESAQKCLEISGLSVDQLSRLIVNKYFGDNLLPMTASRLLGKLGSGTAVHAFDIDGGISSFLYSVDTISRFIGTGDDYILLSSGGIHTRLVSKTDPRVAFLFGDASASLLFGYSKEPHLLASYFYTNHQFFDLATAWSPLRLTHLYLKSASSPDLSCLYDTYHLDNWKNAEEFYRQASREVARNILEESGLGMDDIDLVLVTENNRKLWELTLETLGINETKSISLLQDHGNQYSQDASPVFSV